jgi:deoxyribodipyrimidine photo-lyase
VTAIVWFTRDLRVHDHPALRAALAAHERVVPVFCFDDRLLHGRHASGPRTQFLLDCLAELDASLRARGSGLVVRHGPPERELAKLGADEVYASADVGPFALAREERVRALMPLHTFPGVAAVDDLDAVRTQAGRPYTVFSPFHRTWLGEPRRDVLGAPRKLPPLPGGLRKGRLPSLRSLGLAQEVAEPPRGGEREARRLLRRGSRLSPYLHLGCVSARELEARREGDDEFRRSLCWRDFFQHVLLHFPDNAHAEFQERYRGTLRWRRPGPDFDAWREGRTGYPLVDAGMRQLLREGWMHNRLRLVVGSFLTKDLGIDWRHGERHFMRLLVDGDEANNNGNWQWIASVGTDPQPVSRRIFNPTRQMETYDPDGACVRRHVPELARVPDAYLREPWTMPLDVQRRAGCVIGRDYPGPIVDHAEARREALARYGAARDAGSS